MTRDAGLFSKKKKQNLLGTMVTDASRVLLPFFLSYHYRYDIFLAWILIGFALVCRFFNLPLNL